VKLKKNNNNFLYLIAIFYSVILVLKGFLNPIVYDEAYTFLNYVLTKDFFNAGIANNHYLNTILIAVTTIFSKTELFVRLPNIFFGIAYVFSCCYLVKDLKYKYTSIFLLISSPRLFEYFSLGRGYGIAASLILLGMIIYFKTDLKYKYFIASLLLLLASLSISIYLIVFIVFQIIQLREELKNKKNIIFLIVLQPIVLNIAYLTFLISESGKPLYGYEYIGFDFLIFDLSGMLESFYFYNVYLQSIFFLFFSYLIFKNIKTNKKLFFKNENLIFIFSIISLIVLPVIFSKPFPGGRVLIPILPLFFIFISNLLEAIDIKKKWRFLLIVFFILNFILSLKFYSTIDFGYGYKCSKEYIVEYYQLVENKLYNDKCNLNLNNN